MATWTSLHLKRHLISRTFYSAIGATAITCPARAAFVRVSLVGAGGWDDGRPANPYGGLPGYGAAFARVLTTCTPAETFALQVGDTQHTATAGDALGDSIFTRNTGAVVLCKAKRGTSTAAGAASGCVGDTKRSGSAPVQGFNAPGPYGTAPNPVRGGASAGDTGDAFELGFGGRGAGQSISPGPGGGGIKRMVSFSGLVAFDYMDVPPGDGFACVEFFNRDPTISWPGYTG